MDRRIAGWAAVAALSAAVLGTGTAGAHPMDTSIADDSWINSGLGVHWNSHGAAGSVAGRNSVPPREEGLELVGRFDLGGKLGGEGRVADVSAKGNYAYLTMFYEPTCGRGGVQIVDIGDPANPQAAAYIPSHVDTYSGEGSQVVTLDTPSFKGDLLVYQNEWCPGTTNGVGGITLVDVTNPRRPKKLVEGAGDFTKRDGTQSGGVPQTKANQTHSAFAWEQRDASGRKTGKVYVVLVDDLEEPDVDVLDITNPSKPKIVSETNLDQFAQTGPGRPHGDSVFSHDMIVKHIGGRDIMLMSYWDGGYVTLDVSDPANPKPLSDTDFAAADPARTPFGQTITPEGNAHQAEFTNDDKFFFATDEDFDAYRVQATFTGGPAAGQTFTAIQGGDTVPVNKDNPLAGDTRYLGLGCDPVAPAGGDLIAVVERGVCDFQVKLDNIVAAGYKGLIVFNRTGVDGCETLVTMLAAQGRLPAARRRARRRLHVQRGRHRHADAGRPVGARGHLRRLRRLGLHAHVQDRPDPGREDEGDRHLRPARGPERGLRRELRRHDGPRGGDRPRRQACLRLPLRARHACPALRRLGPRGGRRVRGARRLQLLGGRDPPARRQEVHPGVRPRSRAPDLHLQPVRAGGAAPGSSGAAPHCRSDSRRNC